MGVGFWVLGFHPAVGPERMGKFLTSSTLGEPPCGEEDAHSSQRVVRQARHSRAWHAQQVQGQVEDKLFPVEGHQWPIALWSTSLTATTTLGRSVTSLTNTHFSPEEMDNNFGSESSQPMRAGWGSQSLYFLIEQTRVRSPSLASHS